MTQTSMNDWSDDQLIKYLIVGVPSVSRETAQHILEFRTAIRNRESAKVLEKSSDRMETVTWVILAVALAQLFVAVYQLYFKR